MKYSVLGFHLHIKFQYNTKGDRPTFMSPFELIIWNDRRDKGYRNLNRKPFDIHCSNKILYRYLCNDQFQNATSLK